MTPFKYDLDQEVSLTKSQEVGTILGRAEYKSSENQYYICYQAADGRQVTSWWDESLIEAA